MNVMMASGGYPWTIVRTPRRKVYLDALEAASLVGAKTVIPCHYNTFPAIETDAQAFKSDVEAATGSSVAVLNPGETHST